MHLSGIFGRSARLFCLDNFYIVTELIEEVTFHRVYSTNYKHAVVVCSCSQDYSGCGVLAVG